MPTVSAEASVTQDVSIDEPRKYKVIFNNDNVTPMEFVIALLMNVFHHNDQDATSITLEIHHTGKGIAGIYPYEIAEQKHSESTYIARSNGHPLNINLESE